MFVNLIYILSLEQTFFNFLILDTRKKFWKLTTEHPNFISHCLTTITTGDLTSDLVDELIEHYDKDNDGLLSFPEFIASYKDTKNKLNIWCHSWIIFR